MPSKVNNVTVISRSRRGTAKAVANLVARSKYRPDLREVRFTKFFYGRLICAGSLIHRCICIGCSCPCFCRHHLPTAQEGEDPSCWQGSPCPESCCQASLREMLYCSLAGNKSFVSSKEEEKEDNVNSERACASDCVLPSTAAWQILTGNRRLRLHICCATNLY